LFQHKIAQLNPLLICFFTNTSAQGFLIWSFVFVSKQTYLIHDMVILLIETITEKFLGKDGS